VAITLARATPADAVVLARMVKALTDEIIARTGAPHFDLAHETLTAQAATLMADGTYTVLLALDPEPVGFAALCESAALYAGGRFGIVQEFYVAPDHRSGGVGKALLDAAAAHGRAQGWTRLELCTPPLPEFDRALAFYEREGFEVTGGRKMKRVL
jgi:GNAT superfamily N-acetyltransferase